MDGGGPACRARHTTQVACTAAARDVLFSDCDRNVNQSVKKYAAPQSSRARRRRASFGGSFNRKCIFYAFTIKRHARYLHKILILVTQKGDILYIKIGLCDLFYIVENVGDSR